MEYGFSHILFSTDIFYHTSEQGGTTDAWENPRPFGATARKRLKVGMQDTADV